MRLCRLQWQYVQLAFGHARIPEDYHNEDQPGWIGAARWTTRNARLFAKGKLGDKRYELIRNVLGQPSNSPFCGSLSHAGVEPVQL